EGFEKRSLEELLGLLAFPHQQVRQEAQFEIAARPMVAVKAFADVLKSGTSQLARLHAVWGLGMMARKNRDALDPLFAVVKDKDAEVKRAAVEQLGNLVRHSRGLELGPGASEGQAALKELIADPDARVQAAAAVAYGKIGQPPLARRPPAEQ